MWRVEWIAEVLDDTPAPSPDYQPVGTRDYASPLGLASPVHAGKYACAHGDFVWYRPTVGTPVACCPSHGSCMSLVSD